MRSSGGCFRCQGEYYIHKCPDLTSYQKAHLFIQTQEGEDNGNGVDEKYYDTNVDYHDGVCGFKMDKPPSDTEGVGCLLSLGQSQCGHARPD